MIQGYEIEDKLYLFDPVSLLYIDHQPPYFVYFRKHS
jgi:hypothetical protein